MRAPTDNPDADVGSTTIEAWIRRHQHGPWRYLRVLGCDADLAEDLLQTALIAAIEAGIQARSDALAAAWLRSTVRNLFISGLRARRRRPADAVLTDEVEVEAAFRKFCGADSSGDGAIAALRACLEHVESRSRRALHRCYVDGAERSEIANELGMSVEGVKTLLRRTKQTLRACVDRKQESIR